LADDSGLAKVCDLVPLIEELALEMPRAPEWLFPTRVRSPQEFRFSEIETARARELMARYHYLHSPRMDGRAYALLFENQVAGLSVVSPLDVEHLRRLLHANGCPVTSAAVLSRVFVLGGTPRNCISFLLARTAAEERKHGMTDLLTYVNPNMGFNGVSYRASGWKLLGDEPGTRYCYLDSRYITDREIERQFGKQTHAEYAVSLGTRFAVSTMPLKPLLVFHSEIG